MNLFDIFNDKVEILLPTSSSKVFPDMLEALESSQVLMMKRTTMAMIVTVVKMIMVMTA